MTTVPRSAEDFFEGSTRGLAIFRAIASAVDSVGRAEIRVTKSQIAFRGGRRGFAYVWRPARHLRTDVPTVLSIVLARNLSSPRFKEIAHPSSDVWMHHIEMREPDQVDDEVTGWLREAYESAS